MNVQQMTWYEYDEVLRILKEKGMDKDKEFLTITKRVTSFTAPEGDDLLCTFLRASVELFESKYKRIFVHGII